MFFFFFLISTPPLLSRCSEIIGGVALLDNKGQKPCESQVRFYIYPDTCSSILLLLFIAHDHSSSLYVQRIVQSLNEDETCV